MEKLNKVTQFYYNTKKVKITKPDWIKLRKVLGISLDEF